MSLPGKTTTTEALKFSVDIDTVNLNQHYIEAFEDVEKEPAVDVNPYCEICGKAL